MVIFVYFHKRWKQTGDKIWQISFGWLGAAEHNQTSPKTSHPLTLCFGQVTVRCYANCLKSMSCKMVSFNIPPPSQKHTSTHSHASAAALCYVHNFCRAKQMPASLNIHVHLYSCEVFPKELKATLHLGAKEWVSVCFCFFFPLLQ